MLSTWRRPYSRSLLRLIVCSSGVITPWSRWSDSSSETQNYWETPFPPPAGCWALVLGGSLQSTDTALWESFLGRNVFFIIKNSWTSLWFPHPSGKLRSLNLPKLLLCFALVSQCALFLSDTQVKHQKNNIVCTFSNRVGGNYTFFRDCILRRVLLSCA